MEFILIENKAVDEIINKRVFQSVEYDQGLGLATLLKTCKNEMSLDISIQILENVYGIYILRGEEQIENCIIFDLTQANPFSNKDESEILYILQRILRCAKRVWSNSPLGSHERAIVGTDRIVLFPSSKANTNSYRILMQRIPETTTRANKGLSFQHLLVFKDCYGDNNAEDIPAHEVLKKSFAYLDGMNTDAVRKRATKKSESAAKVPTSLFENILINKLDKPSIHHSMKFEDWLQHLTRDQQRFVNSMADNSSRIEGPAGSGKTLCLVLKCINKIKIAEENNREHHSVFVVHSEATKRNLEDIFSSVDSFEYFNKERTSSRHSIKVTTLLEWCLDKLAGFIQISEILDQDAMESKEFQLLAIRDSLSFIMKHEFFTYSKFITANLKNFFEENNESYLAESLQHEISINIKGRAGEDLERYKKSPTLEYCIPISSEQDKGFIFTIFNKYNDYLRSSAVFDVDDIILSTIGQLDTPLWRRRRTREGFDSIFVDETHLFNLNELSVFHFMLKNIDAPCIAFSVDKSQAIGDRGLTNEAIQRAIFSDEKSQITTDAVYMKSVFRCSPDILDLAFSITNSGALLFTNFENSLQNAKSIFIETDEKKCKKPEYVEYLNDTSMVIASFKEADNMMKELGCSRTDIAIITFSPELFKVIEDYAKTYNKPVELLKARGDIEIINKAKAKSSFVISFPDYVGGLEFDGVVLVGIDKGRVPPVEQNKEESRHFLRYAAHNRLYVAVSRARYRVSIFGLVERKPSELLSSAFSLGCLEKRVK